jgi:beta-barrel assembly-enhancing protease
VTHRPAACALALVTACAASVAPRTAPSVAIDEDERGMWQASAEAQQRLERTDAVVVDAALDQYLLDVASRLEPRAVFAAIPFRIRVLRDMQPNAFCLPNGAIYVHTGMLARMESEAELAVLLAHEMTHATHRHALRHLRSANRTGAALATLGAMVGAGGNGGALLRVVVSGYSRDMEREADREGLALVTAAGYDASDALKMFERLRDWAAEEQVKQGAALYASHPRIQERIDSCREILESSGAGGGARNADAYAEHVAPMLVVNARLELTAGRYAAARRDLERHLRIRLRDAATHLLLGDVARREAAPGYEESALASYRRAVEIDPATADAWRGLGLVLQRQGKRGEARAAFARYLELAPQATDAAHVRAALEATPGGTP